MSFFIKTFLLIYIGFKSGLCDESDEISFTLFKDDKSQTVIYEDLKCLRESFFDPQLPVKIVIHGYRSSCDDGVFAPIKNAYLSKSDVNILCVDWSSLADDFYTDAVNNARFVGVFLSRFIDWLMYNSGLDGETIHLIGHSLGAHIAGVAGSNLRLGVIGKITALDPATTFIDFNPDYTLDLYDAYFVEIIFTSHLSYGHPLGDVNYFINGGLEQPDCDMKLIWPNGVYSSSLICSHSKSIEIFSNSVSCPCLYKAYICDSVDDAQNVNCSAEYVYMNDKNRISGIYSVKIDN